MKKRFYYGALGLLTLGALAACSSEEDQMKNQEKLSMQYQLSVDINDLNTKADWVVDGEDPAEIDECPETSEVDGLITAKRLYANVNVDYGYGTHPEGMDTEMFSLKLEKFGTKLVMEPMILPLGTHHILSVEIMDNNGTTDDTSDDKMIFAGVGTGSKYKNFVPAEHLLPMEFTLDEENYKYQKVEDPFTVLCAVNADPEDFGFEKWVTNFVKVYCIPFLVNKCDLTDGHTVALTRAEVYKRAKDGKTVAEPIFISDMVADQMTGMNTFCISDDKSIPDTDEYYYIKIFDAETGNLIDTYEGYIGDLKDPENHEDYDETYKFIHYYLDECTGCEGAPNATTWAGETFNDKDIVELTAEGWEGLVAPEKYGKPHNDYIKSGKLHLKRDWCNRYVYSPIFYIPKAGKFCVNYPSGYSDDRVSIEVVDAKVATFGGENDNAYLFGGNSNCCKPKVDCVDICEPGCYRIKFTIDGSCPWVIVPPVVLDDVTLTRLESCRQAN